MFIDVSLPFGMASLQPRSINPLHPLLPYGYGYKSSCARPG